LTQKSAAKIEIAPKTAAMPIIVMALPLTPKPLMPAVSYYVGLTLGRIVKESGILCGCIRPISARLVIEWF
jgi:hypothetical protein